MSGTAVTPASDSQQRGFDKDFRWKMSIISAASYLLASLPPVFMDPLLEHHVRYYPPRHYPYALWFVIPLCGLTLLLTSMVMKRSKKIQRAIQPYCWAVVISLVVFRPEFPHGYVFNVSIVWLLFAITTLWFHNRTTGLKVSDCLSGPD